MNNKLIPERKYSWEVINNNLYYEFGISPRIIARILSKLPKGRQKYTKNEVATAYSKIYNKKASSKWDMLIKLHNAGIV